MKSPHSWAVCGPHTWKPKTTKLSFQNRLKIGSLQHVPRGRVGYSEDSLSYPGQIIFFTFKCWCESGVIVYIHICAITHTLSLSLSLSIPFYIILFLSLSLALSVSLSVSLSHIFTHTHTYTQSHTHLSNQKTKHQKCLLNMSSVLQRV